MGHQTTDRTTTDGLARVSWLVAGVPAALGVTALAAAGLAPGPALDGFDATTAALVLGEWRAARMLTAGVGVAALVAGGLGWLALRRSVVQPLDAVAAYLREARRGRYADPPRHAGLVGDIAVLASDLVETQVQVGRYVVSLQNIDTVATSIGEAANAARAEAGRMSEAVGSLTAEIDGARQRIWDSCGTAAQAILGSATKINEARDTLAADVMVARDAPRLIEAALERADQRMAAVFGPGGQVTHLAQGVAEMRAALDRDRLVAQDLARQIAAVASTLQSAPKPASAEGLDAVIADMRALVARVGEARATLEQLRTLVQTPSAELNAVLDTLAAWREDSSLRLAGLSDAILRAAGTDTQRAERIEQAFGDLARHMAALGHALPAEVSNHVAVLAQDMRHEIREQARQLVTATDRSTAVLGGLETVRAQISEEIGGLRAHVDDIARRMPATEPVAPILADLTARIEAARDTVGDALTAGFDQLNETLSSTLGRLPASDAVLGAVGEVGRAVDQLRLTVGTASDADRAAFAALSDRIATTEANVRDDLSAAAARLASDIAAVPGPEPVTLAFGDVARAIETLQADMAAHQARAAVASDVQAAFDLLVERLDAIRAHDDRLAIHLTEIGDAGQAAGKAQRAEITALHDALAAIRSDLSWSVCEITARLTETRAALPDAVSPFGAAGEESTATVDEICTRLDGLAEQIDALTRQPLALARDAAHAPADGLALLSTDGAWGQIDGRLDDIAARLDLLFDSMTGRSEPGPAMAEAIRPEFDRIAQAIALQSEAIGRVREQVGFAAGSMAALPAGLSRDVGQALGQVTTTVSSGLSALTARVDDAAARLAHLTDAVETATFGVTEPSLAWPTGPASAPAPEAITPDVVVALQDRFDEVVARLDMLADTLDGARDVPAFAGPAADVARLLDDRQVELVARIEALRASLERTGPSDWHAAVGRIEATLAAVRHQMVDLRAASPAIAPLEAAIDALRASLAENSDTPVILSALDDIRRMVEDLHAANATGPDMDLPVLTPPSARAVPSGIPFPPPDWREPLDRLSVRIEGLATVVEAALAGPRHIPALPLSDASAAEEAIDTAKFALAEVVLSVEQTLEQPLVEWRAGVAELRSLVSALSPGVSRPAGADTAPAHEVPSVAGAIRIMNVFLETIEERFSHVELLLTGATSQGGPFDSAIQATMDDAVGALREITRQFLDVGCAISGELEAVSDRPRRLDRVAS